MLSSLSCALFTLCRDLGLGWGLVYRDAPVTFCNRVWVVAELRRLRRHCFFYPVPSVADLMTGGYPE